MYNYYVVQTINIGKYRELKINEQTTIIKCYLKQVYK